MNRTNNSVNLRQEMPTPPRAQPNASRLAQAAASTDPRFNIKQFDRAGISRGRGHMHNAGIKAAQNYSRNIADAYDDQLRQQSANAEAMLGLHRGQEEYGQALGALQAQAVYGDQMAALQRQGALYGLLGDLMR